MSTNYTIYLVNESSSTQNFWCFLARPDELVDDPAVFANSSTSLAVASQAPGINTFTIPVQYVVGAGASNNAVGLNILINSSITNNANLKDTWLAEYATVPPNMGPSMKKTGDAAPPNTIAIKSNAFNQANNEANGWFSNMSFGIKTNQGFIGMSWSPSPQHKRTLTPKLKFYVATGTYSSNTLASWSDVSNDSAEISVPYDFQYNCCTVTLTDTGGWVVKPGKPSLAKLLAKGTIDYFNSLIQSHRSLAKAHADIVALARLVFNDNTSPQKDTLSLEETGLQDEQEDTVTGVEWDTALTDELTGLTFLSGTLSVNVALSAAFAFFILGSTKFSITESYKEGAKKVKFSYNGPKGVEAIKNLFVDKALVTFGKK